MSFLFGGKDKQPTTEEFHARIRGLEEELAAAQGAFRDTQELAKHLDADRELLLRAVERIRPGLGRLELAETLLELTFRPLELCSFYVATMDWAKLQLVWVAYHEGGRLRHPGPRDYTTEGGLTGKAIAARAPLYIRTLEEAKAQGAVFSEAEKVSGLVPQSWYGIPLTTGGRPFGLVAFQSFQPDTFSEGRLRVFDALAALLSRAMILGDPALEQPE